MEAEAGQPLSAILIRKELERAAGSGIFFWGIGNALRERVAELVRRTPSPQVFFSVMKSRPRSVDADATNVLMWTSYVDSNGHTHPLPDHVLVLSRSVTTTAPKTRHYALVCHSQTSLSHGHLATLDAGHLKNLGSTAQRLGFSQVTAIVEHAQQRPLGPMYTVAFRATLVVPHFVRLAQPLPLTSIDQKSVTAFATASPTSPTAWHAFVRRLRQASAESATASRAEHAP